jgi:hypothetical protein
MFIAELANAHRGSLENLFLAALVFFLKKQQQKSFLK